MSRSPLIWFGGKGKVAKQIIDKMPKHNQYCEPFVGACHVIAQKPYVSREVINDIDTNLVNFLLVVRSDPERFYSEIVTIPYSRWLYEKWRREPLPEDDFARAVRWFYMNRSAITKGNSEEVSKTGWRHSTSSSQNPAGGYIGACEAIQAFAERMKGVMIECMDFREFIPKYDNPDVMWYVDPPYIGREKYYAGGFDEEAHRDLAYLLNRVKGKVILSYYDDPLLNELYPDWHRETFSAYKQVVGGDGKGCYAEETLLMNFDNGQITLF